MKDKIIKDDKMNPKAKAADPAAKAVEGAVNTVPGRSVYEKKMADRNTDKNRRAPMGGRDEKSSDEFEQKIIDIARVTRVMAGGKRMRFRACVAVGNRKGKVGLGIAKGADVTFAVNKAVNEAKKALIETPIINDTIPHEIYQKFGAAKVLLKPARQGRGVIAGGAVRLIVELSGIKNVTSKILGTNNKVNVAKCTVLALSNLKNIQKKKEDKAVNQTAEAKDTQSA